MKPRTVTVLLISGLLAATSGAAAMADDDAAEEQEIEKDFVALDDYLGEYTDQTDTKIQAALAKGDYGPFCDGFKSYGPYAATAAKWLRKSGWKKAKLSGEIICVMIDACDGVCEVQMDPWKEVKCKKWPPKAKP